MTSSLTTALEELRRENDVLKTDNTQLRTDNATMKDENELLKIENDIIKAENVQLKACHVDTSRSLHPPPVPPKALKHKLKVSQQVVRHMSSFHKTLITHRGGRSY